MTMHGEQVKASPHLRWTRTVLAIPFAMVCVAFAVTLGLWDWRLQHVDGRLARGEVEAAAREWESAERFKPYGAAADLWYSRRLLSIATGSRFLLTRSLALKEALRAGERATQTAEDPQNAWYHLSTLYALAGDTANTERCLRQSVEAAPRWYKPRLTLARLLLLQGKDLEAVREATLAARFSGGRHAEAAQTLAEAKARNQK
jgi:tetratricopeptide (TPR) repeat protein